MQYAWGNNKNWTEGKNQSGEGESDPFTYKERNASCPESERLFGTSTDTGKGPQQKASQEKASAWVNSTQQHSSMEKTSIWDR